MHKDILNINWATIRLKHDIPYSVEQHVPLPVMCVNLLHLKYLILLLIPQMQDKPIQEVVYHAILKDPFVNSWLSTKPSGQPLYQSHIQQNIRLVKYHQQFDSNESKRILDTISDRNVSLFTPKHNLQSCGGILFNDDN